MKQETLPQIIIKYSNNYDDLNFYMKIIVSSKI